MRSDKQLLGIQNYLVGRAEGVDFLHVDELGLTQEEINYIRALGNEYVEAEQEAIRWLKTK